MRAALAMALARRVYDSVSTCYDVQHGLLTARSDQRGRRMLVENAVRDGDRVLDRGAGTGSTALLAARRAGARGLVTLVDMSLGMLVVARRRAQAARAAGLLRFEIGDLLHLPYADDTSDVGFSTHSLCPVGRALRHFHRLAAIRPQPEGVGPATTNPEPLARAV